MSKEKKTTGTYEWAPCRDNCILGCSNDCQYCYAKGNNIRFKRGTAETWKIEHQNTNARPSRHKRLVMFPTSHDLHFEHVNWWGPHLLKLLELGNNILIVTKAEMKAVGWMVENLEKYRNQIEFRLTIGTDDENIRAYWEPGAPAMSERLLCLALLHSTGYRTSVSMEPLLMRDPVPFIARTKPIVSGEIWIGCMNHMALDPAIPEHREQIIINSFDNMLNIWMATHLDPKVRYKDSVVKLLGLKS
jgi:uncharacterized Fe-S cluster-containing radical SAM superfamily protein